MQGLQTSRLTLGLPKIGRKLGAQMHKEVIRLLYCGFLFTIRLQGGFTY